MARLLKIIAVYIALSAITAIGVLIEVFPTRPTTAGSSREEYTYARLPLFPMTVGLSALCNGEPSGLYKNNDTEKS